MTAAPRLMVVDVAARQHVWALPKSGREAIGEAMPAGWRVQFVETPTTADGDGSNIPNPEALAAIADAEAYFGFGISPALFAAGKKLRWVHTGAAGVGATLFPAMIESPVVLTNSAGVHAIPMAETVIAGVLSLLRSLDVARDQQARAIWNREPFVGVSSTVREVSECRVVIVGAGGVGSAIAVRLSALGAECVGIRRRVELGIPPGFRRVATLADLDRELPYADVLVLCAPFTQETKALVTRERLAALPRDAIVVNVSRGALIDEPALVDAVSSGALRGAVLDVFAQEPLAPSSPLWQLRNVILTPHVSAVTRTRYWVRQLDLFLDNWRRYTASTPLRNVVDKRAGY